MNMIENYTQDINEWLEYLRNKPEDTNNVLNIELCKEFGQYCKHFMVAPVCMVNGVAYGARTRLLREGNLDQLKAGEYGDLSKMILYMILKYETMDMDWADANKYDYLNPSGPYTGPKLLRNKIRYSMLP